MTARSPATTSRSGALDLFRIVFTLTVLWAHSYEMVDASADREIFHRMHLQLSWGSVGVDGFFLLSGYLIVQSWLRDPHVSDYLRKRVLRIVPGYAIAVLLSFLAAGFFAPGVPHFFSASFHAMRFWASLLVLDAPLAAPAYPGNTNNGVNGSLWTITYEFRCYLVVALFGVLGLFRRPILWLALTAAFVGLTFSPSLQQHLTWDRARLILGNPPFIYKLFPVFLLGGCYALFRDQIRFRPPYAWAAAAALATLPFLTGHAESWMILFGGYLLMYLARQPFPLFKAWHGMPDVSYGTYLYGWPVQSFLIWLYHPPFAILFTAAAILCLCLGWLSWHFVERPMLQFKPGRQVPLPPA